MRSLLVLALLSSSAFADDLAVSRRLANEPGTGFAQATTEYNDSWHLDLGAEARVWGPLRITASVMIGETARPGVGAGIDITDGLIGYLRFKAEGFSEPEGEIEAMLAFGRQLDQFHVAGMLAYGQDPEGNERDAELGASGQIAVTNAVFAGLAARYRDALGSTKEAIVRDALAGGTGTWRVGQFAVGALVGVAMTEIRGMERKVGAGGTLSLGAAF